MTFSFSLREKVPTGRMRGALDGLQSADSTMLKIILVRTFFEMLI
jgi:hypothetical protein